MNNENRIGEIHESKSCGKFELIEFLGHPKQGQARYRVKFLNTDFITEAYYNNIKVGSVMDKTLSHPNTKYKKGQVLINGKGKQAEILEVTHEPRKSNNNRDRTFLLIKMLDTGYVTKCNPDHFLKSKIKDFLFPTVLGVGILGYVEHLEGRLRDMKEYRIWEGIIHRYYQDDYETKNKSYETAFICERWKRFDYFYEDVKNIKGYDMWKKFHEDNPNTKNVYEFDKDTLILGNKTYSPETCRFLHKSINAGFTSWASEETKLNLLKTIEKESCYNV